MSLQSVPKIPNFPKTSASWRLCGRIRCGRAATLIERRCIDGREVCITRYDTAHRQPHRDVLGRRAGLIEKQWMAICTNSEAFAYAVNDLKANYEEHIGFYLQH